MRNLHGKDESVVATTTARESGRIGGGGMTATVTTPEPPGLANYRDLCAYIATNCPDEIRDGDNAAALAIRWHKILQTLRDRIAELETAKADYEMDTAWQDRLDQCAAILDMVDELPERAENFAASVGEKVADMAKWIETHKTVTDKQKEALDNMQRGCERWLESN